MQTYIIKQKLISISNHFSIYDENEQLIYKMVGGYFHTLFDRLLGGICGISHTTYLKDLSGQSLLMINKKTSSIFEKFEIIQNETIIAQVTCEKKLIVPNILIELNEEKYTIKTDVFARHFTIYTEDEQQVATAKKFLISIKDAYELSIQKEIDPILALSFIYIIDSSFHN